MSTKRVILDTNFLLIPGQHNLDIFSEIKRLMDEPYELFIIEGSLRELKGLAEGNSRDASAAKLAYVLSEQKGLKKLRSSEKHVDDAIIDVVDENVVVATQDKELKKRVREKGGKIITMRQKSRLIMK